MIAFREILDPKNVHGILKHTPMTTISNFALNCLTTIARNLVRLGADRRGNVAIMMGLLMVPIVGAMGLGFEVSHWYMAKRAMQNAADSAAIAAASNASSNYDVEAKAVAALYGFVDGQNNNTVTASNAAACPGGSGRSWVVSDSLLRQLSSRSPRSGYR